MTPDEIKQLVQQEIMTYFASRPNMDEMGDRTIFKKNTQILDARNIQVGRKNGTKIGTETSQKIGFYGVTPVIQGTAISGPSGGATQDSQARNAINSIISSLHNIGIIG